MRGVFPLAINQFHQQPVLVVNSGRLGAVTHSFAKDERVGTRLASISVFQLRGRVHRALRLL
jgi:hypothetical protein